MKNISRAKSSRMFQIYCLTQKQIIFKRIEEVIYIISGLYDSIYIKMLHSIVPSTAWYTLCPREFTISYLLFVSNPVMAEK